MNEYDIVYSYKHAMDKSEQILILADLNQTDEDTIIEILKKAEIFDKKDLNLRRCKRCGREFPAMYSRGIPVCRKCKEIKMEKIDKKKALIDALHVKIREVVKENDKLSAEECFMMEHNIGFVDGIRYAISLIEKGV